MLKVCIVITRVLPGHSPCKKTLQSSMNGMCLYLISKLDLRCQRRFCNKFLLAQKIFNEPFIL